MILLLLLLLFIFLFFLLPKVAFPGFLSHSVRILAGFKLGKFSFFTKIYLSMKTLTDFRKTVETSVDPPRY